jgi:threonine aldolase
MKSFASDNYAGVLPEVMEALQNANINHARSYGADDITKRTISLFKEIFAADVDVYFVFNGTGANVLSLSSCTQSFNSVLCADTSHIYNDESSAPETFTGCRFFPLPSNEHGKITPEVVNKRLIRKSDMHYAQTSILSITQATEYGTIYTPSEISQLVNIAHSNNLYLHIDGSRFFNAATSLNCNIKDISTVTGVDILSLGGTKAGMMFGEAVVVLNKELNKHIAYKHKQSMQLASKTRFIAAQFEAMMQNELWRKHAGHANAMAQQLALAISQYKEVSITKPVQANAVFARIPGNWNEPLQSAFPFYVWDEHTNEVRLMCSFDTTIQEIQDFSELMKGLAS